MNNNNNNDNIKQQQSTGKLVISKDCHSLPYKEGKSTSSISSTESFEDYSLYLCPTVGKSKKTYKVKPEEQQKQAEIVKKMIKEHEDETKRLEEEKRKGGLIYSHSKDSLAIDEYRQRLERKKEQQQQQKELAEQKQNEIIKQARDVIQK